LKSTFEIAKKKGPVQVFASALKTHNNINLVFETNATIVFKKMYPTNLILFSQIQLLVPLI